MKINSLSACLCGGLLCLLADSATALTFHNCGADWTLTQRPRRIIAANQHAADILLALNVQSELIGVSYIDDDLDALQRGRYQGVPVIARHYPSAETFYGSQADFVVAGFSSAFTGGPGDRETLYKNHIGSYLLSAAYATAANASIKHVIADIRTLGEIVGRSSNAAALIADHRQKQRLTAALPPLSPPPSVFFFDSGSLELYTQGQRGFITALLHDAGAENVFADVRQQNAIVSAEALLQRNPDVILLADAVWSSADSKKQFLQHHPALSTLRAVREKRYIVIPFSRLYPSIHSGDTLYSLALRLRQF